ncbi:uncharacterized protein TM35_000012380 [Trypanosoma theileri]|uniref:Surface protein TolT n=1 Tax=Trypanosoma theileri TaxID=67003 RepID=A0A1X0P957_9TRYP|nr:uncharacterized protein TM35_000012380 [Trypanosoma theileri]ORC93361.1 hypothetical protein TM35_000012380 [Trypanosoma theileri]
MSMLSCRVLCLLAIVLCCVGVARADASAASLPQYVMKYVEQAKKLAEETKELKEKCEKATETAREAAYEAQRFVVSTRNELETIAADPKKVMETKSKGYELIDKAMKAAVEAGELANKTTDSERETDDNVSVVQTYAEEHKHSVPKEIKDAEEAVKDAQNAVYNAKDAEGMAHTHANDVKNVLKELDAAVAAAEKKEKQLESQQQGHTEGNKTEETQEKQKEKQKQHYRSTFTINIHGDNLDALFNGGANNSGMALNDGSSNPASLRVPLLLLLLSVLGCMAVC